jgi:hypothetical protein
MRKSGLMLFLLLARANAQQPTNIEGFSGVVRNVSVESKGVAATLSIESGTARIAHQVHCTETTKITKDGKTVPLVQIKKGQKVECSGTPNGEVLEATTCTIR